MENKQIILRFRNGDWQKVICKDFQLVLDEEGLLSDIQWEECEGHTIPFYLEAEEVIGVFPNNYKAKTIAEHISQIETELV